MSSIDFQMNWVEGLKQSHGDIQLVDHALSEKVLDLDYEIA